MSTGERVIPSEAEQDLWNEHISRYYFAALFAAGKIVLDAGCGTGYGTALLAEQAGDVAGFDISPEAISYASGHYSGLRFLLGSASAFPAAENSVDVVTAFELIEHLPDWQILIKEADRVLKESGVFLVSATRAEIGFALPAFEEALGSVFPFVRILAQNRQQCIVFSGEQAMSSGLSFVASVPDLAQAHLYVAVCAKQPVEIPRFTYVPGNTWALSLDRELDAIRTDFSLTRAELVVTREDLARARAEVDRLTRERELAATSRWVRLGRRFNLGPDLRNTTS